MVILDKTAMVRLNQNNTLHRIHVPTFRPISTRYKAYQHVHAHGKHSHVRGLLEYVHHRNDSVHKET